MKKVIKREEHIIDATDRPLGRIASEISVFLCGKNKPQYEPHHDTGDFVKVQNIQYMKLTGKKLQQKVYYRNTGYPGGIRTTLARDLLKNNPEKLLRMSVRDMLPKNTLRTNRLKRLIIE